MFYIRSSDLIHLMAESLYPLPTSSYFPHPAPALSATFLSLDHGYIKEVLSLDYGYINV